MAQAIENAAFREEDSDGEVTETKTKPLTPDQFPPDRLSDSAINLTARITRLMQEAPPVITEAPPSTVVIAVPGDFESLQKIYAATGLGSLDEIVKKFHAIALAEQLDFSIQMDIMTGGCKISLSKRSSQQYKTQMNEEHNAFIRHFEYELC